jgi:hypothetical protein
MATVTTPRPLRSRFPRNPVRTFKRLYAVVILRNGKYARAMTIGIPKHRAEFQAEAFNESSSQKSIHTAIVVPCQIGLDLSVLTDPPSRVVLKPSGEVVYRNTRSICQLMADGFNEAEAVNPKGLRAVVVKGGA